MILESPTPLIRDEPSNRRLRQPARPVTAWQGFAAVLTRALAPPGPRQFSPQLTRGVRRRGPVNQ